MSSAQARVFNTPELLEAILSQLPPHDLLLAQRISRPFQAAITSSPTLQQLLFIRAAPVKDPKEWSLNPLLRDLFAPFFVVPAPNARAASTFTSLQRNEGCCTSEEMNALLRKEASWRRLLLLQPPVRVLGVTQLEQTRGGNVAYDARFSFEGHPAGGVTMGVVYDITESFTRSRGGGFGLSVLEADDELQVTLYLLNVAQCTMGYVAYTTGPRSEGAETAFWSLELEEREDESAEMSFDSTWTTDLSVERGGVDVVEFESWKRKRGLFSSLLWNVH